jgi:hypothetical protein
LRRLSQERKWFKFGLEFESHNGISLISSSLLAGLSLEDTLGGDSANYWKRRKRRILKQFQREFVIHLTMDWWFICQEKGTKFQRIRDWILERINIKKKKVISSTSRTKEESLEEGEEKEEFSGRDNQ